MAGIPSWIWFLVAIALILVILLLIGHPAHVG